MSVPWIPYDSSWISIGTAAVVACVVVGIASASAIFYAPILWAAIRLQATRDMPPLPPGKIGIPYLGESLDYMRSWSNLHSLDMWYDTRKAKHGGIFKTHILGKPTVVMLGAEANKFILTNEDKLFRNLWPKSLRVLIGKHSMTSSQGDDHRRVRRIIHSVLGIENLKKSVARFERLVLQHLDSEWRSGHVIYAHNKLREMALCVATEYFMGLRAGEELESFTQNYYDLNKGLLSHPLDLPWTVFGKAKRARVAIVAQIAKQIHLRKNSLGKRGEEEENFLDMVLRAQKEGGEFCLSDEEIIDNLLGFLIGGFDTTASALATVLKHLSLSPHVLQRLRKDCEKLRDSKEVEERLTWNEIKSVKFMSNVVAEGMRIVPPINGGFKEAKIDIPYGGYTIPKGWKVHFSMRQTSNTEEYFRSPEKFFPDRFNEPQEPFSYIPFGQGNRMCPGNEFAKIEMEIFLYHLVLRYNWELVEVDEPISISFTSQPTHGLPLMLRSVA
ncbi:hypothetical protein SUGI_0377680 [Cryptomeria japonica]|nr:hypothetical protein SUGI_0377680 [Cryptomeria japonica]